MHACAGYSYHYHRQLPLSQLQWCKYFLLDCNATGICFLHDSGLIRPISLGKNRVTGKHFKLSDERPMYFSESGLVKWKVTGYGTEADSNVIIQKKRFMIQNIWQWSVHESTLNSITLYYDTQSNPVPMFLCVNGPEKVRLGLQTNGYENVPATRNVLIATRKTEYSFQIQIS